MSGNVMKSKKFVLICFVVVVLLAVCFTAVGLYAKNEFSKPRFTMPDQPELPCVSELPTDGQAAAAYVQRQYEAAIAADDVMGSWNTDVDLGGEMTAPFTQSDQKVVDHIRENAGGQIAELYPSASDVSLTEAEAAPSLPLPAAVLAFEAEQRDESDKAAETESGKKDYYYIKLELDPACVDTQDMLQSEIYKQIGEVLAPAVSIDSAEINAQSVTLEAKVDRLTDHLLSADVTRVYQIRASVSFTQSYSALVSGKTAEIILPYTTYEHIRFSYFGIRFTERAMAVKPGDMKRLPLDFTISEKYDPDYTLTFDVSHPDTMSIDDDGVMTVNRACDDPVTVTAALEYHGHTYSDTMTMYITELEVESDE